MPDGPAWLPSLDADDLPEIRLAGHTVVDAPFSVPSLSADHAARVADHARAAALEARTRRGIGDVTGVVARAACRLADAEDVYGRLACEALQRSGGWSPDEAADLLASNARGWTEEALSGILRSELGDPTVLDAPQADLTRPGLRRRAVGPPVLLLILSGNVPGISVTAVIRGLLARSAVLCKLSQDEPDLVGIFARALHEEAPDLAETIAATWWPAEDPGPAAGEWTKRCSKVIVYGGEAAVRAVRASTPAHIPLLEYGPRLGIACLGPQASSEDLEALAADVCAYDQAGCVSPRLVYVLSDSGQRGQVSAMVEHFTHTLSTTVTPASIGRLRDSEAAAIRSARTVYQFAEGEGRKAFGAPDLSWTVLVQEEPGVYSENLPRVVWAYGIPSVEALRQFGSVLEGRVQAIGTAGLDAAARAELEALGVEWGVSRVVPVGKVAWPPAEWRHNGQMQILPLLNWTEFEE